MSKMERLEIRMERFSKYLILFLAVFIPSRNVLEFWLGTGIKVIPDVLILLSAVVLFIYKKGKIKLYSYDIFMLLFLAVAFVNTILIQKISLVTYMYEVRSIMVYYILFVVIREFEFEESYLLCFTRILKYVTYILFGLGLIEKLSDKMFLFPVSVAEKIIYADNYARVYSMFFNPNTYGAFLVMAFFLVIHYEQEKENLLYKIITIASLLLSMSRSSILILVIGLLVYALPFKRKLIFSKKMIVHVLFVVVAGFMVYIVCEKTTDFIHGFYENDELGENRTSVLDRFKDLKEDEIIEESNTDGRIYYVKTGLKVFQDYPILGTGFGTYGSAASMNWKPPIYEKYQLKYGFYSDNEYIKDLVETGLVGIACLVLFCVTLIYVYRKNPFCIGMCIIVGWFGLFYNVLEVQIVAFLFWTMLGMQAKK